MEINNYVGPILAFTVFATIGIGHVLVRYLNYHFGIKPGVYLFVIGLGFLVFSVFIQSDLWSSVIGIIGMTVVWDGIEIYRQEKRVLKGYAPKNPNRKYPNE